MNEFEPCGVACQPHFGLGDRVHRLRLDTDFHHRLRGDNAGRHRPILSRSPQRRIDRWLEHAGDLGGGRGRWQSAAGLHRSRRFRHHHADIRTDHLPDLPRPQQLAESLAVDAGIVAGNRQVLDSRRLDRIDQLFRNTTEPEAPVQIIMPSISSPSSAEVASGNSLLIGFPFDREWPSPVEGAAHRSSARRVGARRRRAMP